MASISKVFNSLFCPLLAADHVRSCRRRHRSRDFHDLNIEACPLLQLIRIHHQVRCKLTRSLQVCTGQSRPSSLTTSLVHVLKHLHHRTKVSVNRSSQNDQCCFDDAQIESRGRPRRLSDTSQSVAVGTPQMSRAKSKTDHTTALSSGVDTSTSALETVTFVNERSTPRPQGPPPT